MNTGHLTTSIILTSSQCNQADFTYNSNSLDFIEPNRTSILHIFQSTEVTCTCTSWTLFLPQYDRQYSCLNLHRIYPKLYVTLYLKATLCDIVLKSNHVFWVYETSTCGITLIFCAKIKIFKHKSHTYDINFVIMYMHTVQRYQRFRTKEP